MLVLESKLVATSEQFALIDEAIRTFQFIRNKALRYWIDTKGATKYDLNKQYTILAKEFTCPGFPNHISGDLSRSRGYGCNACPVAVVINAKLPYEPYLVQGTSINCILIAED